MVYLHYIPDETKKDAVLDDLRRNPPEELKRELRAKADALLGNRPPHPPIEVLTRGLEAEGSEKERVEAELREIVVEEIVKEALEGAGSEQEELPPPRGSGTIEVALGGLSWASTPRGFDLPETALRRIEARVHERIEPIVEPFIVQEALGCACFSEPSGEDFRVRDPETQELTTDITVLDKHPDTKPIELQPDYLIAIVPPFNVIEMRVRRARQDSSPGFMRVALGNTTEWEKAIEFQNLCYGKAGELYVSGNTDGVYTPSQEIAEGCHRTKTHTLRFTKPGFMKIWHPVFQPRSDHFWDLLEERRVRFLWTVD